MNPREDTLALETLVSAYLATLIDSDTGGSLPANGNGRSTAVGSGAAPERAGSPQQFHRREQEREVLGSPSEPLPILQPAKSATQVLPSNDNGLRGDRSSVVGVPGAAIAATGAKQGDKKKPAMAMTEVHATEVFRVSERSGQG